MASAQSVPGRMGSHRSAWLPSGSRMGRMSMTRQPAAMASRRLRGSPWLAPEASVLQPQTTSSLVLSSCLGAALRACLWVGPPSVT